MAKPSLFLAFLALLISACGGGSSSGGDTGILNLAITDAPYEDVEEVWINFTGVSLKPQTGGEIVIEFVEPKKLNLMTLQKGITAGLLDNEKVPAGRYNWIRLAVDAEEDGQTDDSHAMLATGEMKELVIPSGHQSGLKLVSGFNVLADHSTNLVIDWVLSKALSYPQGKPNVMHIRPALRITDMATYGTLAGTVDETLLNNDLNETANCSNDLAMDTGNAVYVYTGGVESPTDINSAIPDVEPLVVAPVNQNMDGIYAFEIHYMPVGDYTVAFTCQASDDEAETAQAIEFAAQTNAKIVDGETTMIELPPPPPPE